MSFWRSVLINFIIKSVLLENIPLIKFIKKLHLGPEWFIFHNLTREFMDDVILVIVDDHEVLPSVEDIDVCS